MIFLGKLLACQDCGRHLSFTARWQESLAQHGFPD